MPRLQDYLDEVQRRLNFNPVMVLIRDWTPQEISSAEGVIQAAIGASGLIGANIPNFVGTNQSKGNKAADHFLTLIPPHLHPNFRIMPANGAGYPDRIFWMNGSGYCLEMKATSNWNNADGNRRVLTSSPAKLRNLVNGGQLAAPPAHMICTVLYDDSRSRIDGIRLDFPPIGSKPPASSRSASAYL